MSDVLIIIDRGCYSDESKFQQYIKKTVTYIIDNGKLVKKGNYEVYYIK